MKLYFLDTSVIIDYLRGKKDIIDTVDNLDGKLTSSYVCLAELFEGMYRSKNKKVESIMIELFSGFHKVYGLNQEIAQRFGLLRKELKQKGNIIEDLDIFIAATCLTHNCILITLNTKHFSRIDALQILK